jgi:hypothetical protein
MTGERAYYGASLWEHACSYERAFDGQFILAEASGLQFAFKRALSPAVSPGHPSIHYSSVKSSE